MMELHEIDERLGIAKAKWDHGDAQYEPAALALIRAAESMRENLILPTIRVVEKGDFDDQMMLRVIGPFDTEAERNAELDRLKGLPLMSELAWLSASTIPPCAAEQSITAAVCAQVSNGNELFEELSK